MKIFLLLIFFLGVHFSKSQSIEWKNNASNYPVGKHIEVLEDKTGTLTFSDVSSQAFRPKFINKHQPILNFGFTESYYWLRFTIQNYTNNKLYFEIAHAFLSETDMFYLNRYGKLVHLRGGFKTTIKEKIVKSHFQVFPLPNGKTEIYVRLLSNSHPLPVNIRSDVNFENISRNRYITYGLYIGFMFFMIFSQLINAYLLRSGLHLLYCVVVITYMCYVAMVMDGFILYFIDSLDLMVLYLTIPTIGVIVQMVYCLVFLEVMHYTPKLKRVILGAIAYFSIYALIRPFLPLISILAINTINALFSFFLMAFIGILIGRSGNKIGYYFSFAYVVYFILVLIEAIYIQTGYPTYLFLSHVAMGTVVEVIILSYLLIKKGKQEKAAIEYERQEVQQKLIESIQENEKLLSNQNSILKKEVAMHTRRLEKTNKQLSETLVSKDKFLSIVAHDIKGPLNSVLNFSNLIIDNKQVDDKERHELFLLMNGQLKRTYKFISDLLDWTKAQSKKKDFKPTELNVTLVVDEVIELLHHAAGIKSIDIINNLSRGLLLFADHNMLMTIFRNLISNAIKFTPEGGRIIIDFIPSTMKSGVDYYIFCVKDNGVGIPPHIKETMLGNDNIQSTRGTNNERGSGLGLLICKEFVENHGGKLWLNSVVGEGTEFFFSINGNLSLSHTII